MVDVVTEVILDLTKLVAQVPAVQQKIVYMYDQDELLDAKKQLGFPAVGIVYVGLRGKDDSSRSGLAAEIVCDIYLLGAESCTSKLIGADQKPSTTSLLDNIRNEIKCNVAPGQRKWKFVFEQPVQFTQDVLAYVQRWSITVVLTWDRS